MENKIPIYRILSLMLFGVGFSMFFAHHLLYRNEIIFDWSTFFTFSFMVCGAFSLLFWKFMRWISSFTLIAFVGFLWDLRLFMYRMNGYFDKNHLSITIVVTILSMGFIFIAFNINAAKDSQAGLKEYQDILDQP